MPPKTRTCSSISSVNFDNCESDDGIAQLHADLDCYGPRVRPVTNAFLRPRLHDGRAAIVGMRCRMTLLEVGPICNRVARRATRELRCPTAAFPRAVHEVVRCGDIGLAQCVRDVIAPQNIVEEVLRNFHGLHTTDARCSVYVLTEATLERTHT
jgi:hypothetical protein